MNKFRRIIREEVKNVLDEIQVKRARTRPRRGRLDIEAEEAFKKAVKRAIRREEGDVPMHYSSRLSEFEINTGRDQPVFISMAQTQSDEYVLTILLDDEYGAKEEHWKIKSDDIGSEVSELTGIIEDAYLDASYY